jgi:large subunit ribosomal protein L4
MKYTIKQLDIENNKPSQEEFEGCEIEANLKQNVYLLYNNQKKSRFVSAFTKSRSDFTSGGAKPYKQKGTGKARQGTIRTPLKVGGAVIFGPKPRLVKRKTNQKYKYVILQQLLLSKLSNSSVHINSQSIKKVSQIKKHITEKKKYLYIIDVNAIDDIHVFTRIKNLQNVYFNNVNALSVEDILRVDEIIYSNASFTKIFNNGVESND